jgi:hypothetical protein
MHMVFCCKYSVLVVILIALALPALAVQGSGSMNPTLLNGETIDRDADKALRSMSDYLTSLKAFTCNTDNAVEVVTKQGEKLQFLSSSSVSFQRPNKLRSDRVGDVVDASFYYDGTQFALYGKNINMYVVLPAPSTIDQALDEIRSKYGIDPPAADLLYDNPYSVLMEDVVSGKDLGPSYIHGTRCRHLAYRAKEVDWQLWVEDDSTPLPRRYVITSKDVIGSPEYIVNLDTWNTSPTFPSGTFTFVPPAGAQKVSTDAFLKALEGVH